MNFRAAAAALVSAPLLALPAAPAGAVGLTVPVQCEVGSETVLAWDGVAYDLRGTCGVVRVTADDATVTMPSATRLVIEGTGNAVDARPVYDLVVLGAGTTVSTPSLTSLVLAGAGSSVSVAGIVERAELTGTGSSLTADTVNVLRLRGTDGVTARKAYRVRITGQANALRLKRADRLVLTGDANVVTVARGRTTVRDRGEGNVLDLRRRERR
ncbi:hypothetical protein GCM10011376_33110 [Nocardioides flavus (ex Wang et al. 2016)]|uniref:DUF3060 domain-containing protein n=1 Tax=Nocardioides flavus (ex Wang et al. 2016) TaxID=2058780 RepID=A0ABQ3HMD2_9ACTN|nr:DUF3060 domain-containing protein [Nocardioides flavus (ex Wang et al. 2016)]GHE18701.1 hypothetical protein GCM10011376_33110 [Nocardioides flavus (ex Wang et al. 2016)]